MQHPVALEISKVIYNRQKADQLFPLSQMPLGYYDSNKDNFKLIELMYMDDHTRKDFKKLFYSNKLRYHNGDH